MAELTKSNGRKPIAVGYMRCSVSSPGGRVIGRTVEVSVVDDNGIFHKISLNASETSILTEALR